MYHIFIDFEMTCWGKGDKLPENRVQEIIEIGAAKLDDQFRLVDTFSIYVKPENNPVLSKTCTQLTGISNDDVISSPSLTEAIIIFEDWLGEEKAKFYSWGDDDRAQLETELIGKGLCSFMPLQYRRWLDFQGIFMRVYGFAKRMGLKDAVEMMGFDFEGRQHRAVYDAVNGARLLMLIKDKNKHMEKKRLMNEVYNNSSTFTSTIGELLSGKLSKLGLVS